MGRRSTCCPPSASPRVLYDGMWLLPTGTTTTRSVQAALMDVVVVVVVVYATNRQWNNFVRTNSRHEVRLDMFVFEDPWSSG